MSYLPRAIQKLFQRSKSLSEGARNKRPDFLLVWLNFNFEGAHSSPQKAPQIGESLRVSWYQQHHHWKSISAGFEFHREFWVSHCGALKVHLNVFNINWPLISSQKKRENRKKTFHEPYRRVRNVFQFLKVLLWCKTFSICIFIEVENVISGASGNFSNYSTFWPSESEEKDFCDKTRQISTPEGFSSDNLESKRSRSSQESQFSDASTATKSTPTSNLSTITRRNFIPSLTKCRLRARSARSDSTATRSSSYTSRCTCQT